MAYENTYVEIIEVHRGGNTEGRDIERFGEEVNYLEQHNSLKVILKNYRVLADIYILEGEYYMNICVNDSDRVKYLVRSETVEELFEFIQETSGASESLIEKLKEDARVDGLNV